MSENGDQSDVQVDYKGRMVAATRVDRRILLVIYMFVVAAMVTSSLLVTNFGYGFDERIPQVVIAAVLGVAWTAYYAWAIHPKVIEHAIEEED